MGTLSKKNYSGLFKAVTEATVSVLVMFSKIFRVDCHIHSTQAHLFFFKEIILKDRVT